MPRPLGPLSDATRLGGMAATSKRAGAAGREVGSHVGAGGVDVDLPKIFSKAPAVIRSKTSLKWRQSLSKMSILNLKSLLKGACGPYDYIVSFQPYSSNEMTGRCIVMAHFSLKKPPLHKIKKKQSWRSSG